MKWAPADAVPGLMLAVLSGDPSKAQPFVMETRWAAGAKAAPHWHSQTERVTIVSGNGVIGMGDAMDISKGMPMGQGVYAEMPAKMHHWFVAQTPVVMLIEGDGPFDIQFVNPADDPRKKTQ